MVNIAKTFWILPEDVEMEVTELADTGTTPGSVLSHSLKLKIIFL